MRDQRLLQRKICSALTRCCLLVVLLCCLMPLRGAESYRYTTPDGKVLFTDIRMNAGELRQQQNGEAGVRSSYRGSYGRAPATSSCQGLTEQALEARYTRIDNYIRRAASAAQLDPLLLKAIARVESCFDPQAVSVAGARGVMQLMPATAKSLGVVNSFDAGQNISGGARYLARLLKRFKQDNELALAAYNAGPTAVEKYGGIPPYKETRRYVPLVLSFYQRFSADSGTRSAEPQG